MAKLFGIKHSWQQGKKMVGPISFTIIVFFFGSTNLYKNDDEA